MVYIFNIKFNIKLKISNQVYFENSKRVENKAIYFKCVWI